MYWRKVFILQERLYTNFGYWKKYIYGLVTKHLNSIEQIEILKILSK